MLHIIPIHVGWYVKEALVRLCNHWKWPQQALHSGHRGDITQLDLLRQQCAVLPLFPCFIPHAEWNAKCSPYPKCAVIEFGKSLAVFAAPGFCVDCDLLAWATVYTVVWNTNESHYSGWAILTFGKSFVRWEWPGSRQNIMEERRM